MDAEAAQNIVNRLMPGEGNVQNGAVRLTDRMYWAVPFKNVRYGELQAFFKDRDISAGKDLASAEAELRQSIGSAVANSG